MAWSMAKTMDDGMFIPGTCSYMIPGDKPWYSRLNKNGGVVFQNLYYSIDMFHAYSTALNSDGGYIVAGEQANIGTIARLDSIGNVMWARTYNNVTKFTSIIQTADGGFAALGASPLGANGCIMLEKLQPSGAVTWSNCYDLGNQDLPAQVRQTNSVVGFDGYIIAGSSNSINSNWDMWIIKTDLTGNPLWQKMYGNPAVADGANVIEQTNDLGYIVGGYTTNLAQPNQEMVLLKIDSSGNFLWDRMYPAQYNEQVWDIDLTSDGGYILAGGIGIAGTPGHYLIKTDNMGNIQWQKDYIRLDIRQVYQDSTGHYLAAGTSDTSSSRAYDVFGMRTDSLGNVGACPLILPAALPMAPANFVKIDTPIAFLAILPQIVTLAPTLLPAMGSMMIPCTATPPGAVPDNDNYAGTPLTIAKSGANLALSWSAPGGTCLTTDYGIYRGSLPFSTYDHAYLTCTTSNTTSYSVAAGANSSYYLVVAQNTVFEGLYGLDSANSPIPAAAIPCMLQSVGTCN